MNPYLDDLAQWFEDRRLEISAPKSTASLFTTSSNESGKTLPISIKNTAIPTTKEAKILGVTFDPLLTFNKHVKNVQTKVKQRNNILKALAGSTWGKQKELLLDTYKSIGRSVMNYAAPVWSPYVSKTNWSALQATQNQALRTATGCTKMSDRDHLHTESKVLPVKEHSQMLKNP